MSAARYIELTCDKCGHVDYFQTNDIRRAREEAARGLYPWEYVGGHDLCNRCC